MNPAVTARAVLTRLKADATLWTSGTSTWAAALAGGASYNRANPNGLTFPFLVYSVEWTADLNFTGIDGDVRISFDIYDEDTQGTSRLEVLIDRLIGNSMLAAPGSRTAPTYGFHYHELGLPALGSTNIQGAVASHLSLQSSAILPADTLQANTAALVFTGRVANQAVVI